LADITNDHERFYNVTVSQLITGTVPIVMKIAPIPMPMETVRTEYMASATADSSISSRPQATTTGSYTYTINRAFQLWPKSIKTFPFISTSIVCNYTLEASTYLSVGLTTGLFQRVFTIQPWEFLPAGTATFYLNYNGITLGQGRLADTAARNEQRVALSTDPDVKYTVTSLITATRQMPTYGQDLQVNISMINRKEQQSIAVTLIVNSGYRETSLVVMSRSSNITVVHDPTNRSNLLIRAHIRPNGEESSMILVKQSN
jgi:hypothetical protein